MIKILFICHGNICRSVMAENIMKKLVAEQDKEKEYIIDSAATSNEEIGNLIYPKAKAVLDAHGIYSTLHHARMVIPSDMGYYDYIICMDNQNVEELFRIVPRENEKKVTLLLEYADASGDIADPWYTDDFEKAYSDIERGCKGLLYAIEQKQIDI